MCLGIFSFFLHELNVNDELKVPTMSSYLNESAVPAPSLTFSFLIIRD